MCDSNNLYHPDNLRASDIGSTGGKPDTWELRYSRDAAATMRQEWMRYTNTRKGHGSNNPLTMDDFRGYIKFWYETDILA